MLILFVFTFCFYSIPVISLRSLLPANGYAVSVAYLLSIPKATTAVLLDYKPSMRLMHNGHERKMLQTTESPTTTSPTTSSGGTTTIGTYSFRFLINDALNPNPPIVSSNLTINNNGTLIRGYQIQMRVFVEVGAPIKDPTDPVQLVNYTLSVFPSAVAATLNIGLSQIIDQSVSVTPPITGLSKYKGKMKRNRFNAKAVTGTVLYVSFVLIPALNSTITADQLAATFIASQTLPTIIYNFNQVFLAVDTSTTILRTLVYIDVILVIATPPTLAPPTGHPTGRPSGPPGPPFGPPPPPPPRMSTNDIAYSVTSIVVFLMFIWCLYCIIIGKRRRRRHNYQNLHHQVITIQTNALAKIPPFSLSPNH